MAEFDVVYSLESLVRVSREREFNAWLVCVYPYTVACKE